MVGSMVARTFRGICLEKRGRRAVILTADGAFIEGVVVGAGDGAAFSAGDEVEVYARQRITWRKIIPAAAAAALAVFVIGGRVALPPAGPGSVYAWVSVDVNPGVELGLDYKDVVVEAEPTDADGERVLAEMGDIRGKPFEAFLEAFLEVSLRLCPPASAEGGEAVVVIAASPEKVGDAGATSVTGDRRARPGVSRPPAPAEALEAKVQRWATVAQRQLAKANAPGRVLTAVVPRSVKEEAKELSVSTGKYVVWMEAAEEGVEVSLEELREGKISSSIAQAGGNPARVLERLAKPKSPLQYADMLERAAQRIEKMKHNKEDGDARGKAQSRPAAKDGNRNQISIPARPADGDKGRGPHPDDDRRGPGKLPDEFPPGKHKPADSSQGRPGRPQRGEEEQEKEQRKEGVPEGKEGRGGKQERDN